MNSQPLTSRTASGEELLTHPIISFINVVKVNDTCRELLNTTTVWQPTNIRTNTNCAYKTAALMSELVTALEVGKLRI